VDGLAFPSSFEVKTTEPNGLAVVAVVGELDVATVPQLSQELDGLAEPGRVILVDLSETEFMDCAGIAALVVASEHQRELGGDLILDAPTRAVSRLIECTQIDKLVTVASGAETGSS
jgi:anti-sigma B factor antagonist